MRQVPGPYPRKSGLQNHASQPRYPFDGQGIEKKEAADLLSFLFTLFACVYEWTTTASLRRSSNWRCRMGQFLSLHLRHVSLQITPAASWPGLVGWGLWERELPRGVGDFLLFWTPPDDFRAFS